MQGQERYSSFTCRSATHRKLDAVSKARRDDGTLSILPNSPKKPWIVLSCSITAPSKETGVLHAEWHPLCKRHRSGSIVEKYMKPEITTKKAGCEDVHVSLSRRLDCGIWLVIQISNLAINRRRQNLVRTLCAQRVDSLRATLSSPTPSGNWERNTGQSWQRAPEAPRAELEQHALGGNMGEQRFNNFRSFGGGFAHGGGGCRR